MRLLQTPVLILARTGQNSSPLKVFHETTLLILARTEQNSSPLKVFYETTLLILARTEQNSSPLKETTADSTTDSGQNRTELFSPACVS